MAVAGMNVDTGQKTWLTPKSIVDALGPFDMDPCVPDNMPWQTAKRMVTKAEDGLIVPWEGTVWLNPPYGRESVPFLRKMAEHRNGVALLFGRTDTAAWHELVFPVCDSVLFMRGRIKFFREDGTEAGSANAPSCLVSYTPAFTAKLRDSGIPGYLMKANGRCGANTMVGGAVMPDEPGINPYRMIYVETAAEYLAKDFIPRYMAWFHGTEEAKRIPADYGPDDVARLAADWDEKHRPSAAR